MSIERLNRPATAVAQMTEVKDHARVDGDHFDGELARMLASAQLEAEGHGSLALFDQSIRVILPSWPRKDTYQLPIIPLLDFSTVTVAVDGVTFDDFAVITGLRPALRIERPIPQGEVIIDYVAGFGPLQADVPDDLREAILDQAATYFDARGAEDRRTVTFSAHFARIVGRYRRVAI